MISKDLLIRVKRQARIKGKSLTEHFTDLVANSLSANNIQDSQLFSINQIKDLEERLLFLESIVRNRKSLSQKLKPFTNAEAINFTKFMRGVFYKELETRNFDDKSEAFDDFLHSLKAFDELDKPFPDRLKEIMLSDKPTPWTGKELNEFTCQDKCNCAIRKALINWTGKIECPSQQEICDKGEELVALF